LAFALLVAHRLVQHWQPALLVWMLGLLCYAVSTAAQAIGQVHGWDSPTYRLWYLSGACYTAAFLGMGTIYLIAPRWVANCIFGGLLVGSLMVVPLVLLVPLDLAALPAAGAVPTGAAYSGTVRTVTPVFNIFGAGALGLGALWGALNFWQRGRRQRAFANLAIAAGSVVPSFASGLTRFGITGGLALGQLAGLWLILAGFLLAMRAGPTPAATRADDAPENSAHIAAFE
jgi:hypothetical protein